MRARRQPRTSTAARRTAVEPRVERLVVERVVAGGDGLARDATGRVVFVPGALPGEVVDARVVSSRRDYARATIDRVVQAHPARVEPPCPAFARGCGGCDWQHSTPELQLSMKADIVRDALRRTGRLDATVVDEVVEVGGAAAPWRYRTSMRFTTDPDGRLGLRRHRSHEVVVLDGCPISDAALSELIPRLRVPGADEVSVRVDGSGAATVLWGDGVLGPDAPDLPDGVATGPAGSLVQRVPVDEGVHVDLRVGAPSFFQSGPAAAALLVRAVRELAGDQLDHAGVVVDAYGGVGLLACGVLAGRDPAPRVVLVEGAPSSCADATHNLRAAGLDGEVHHGAVESWSPVAADVVLADPSRAGLGADAARVLDATGAGLLVLVSCDPVALARDVTLLRELGWRLERCLVLDLFPQTHHVETVSRFVRTAPAPRDAPRDAPQDDA